MRRLKKERWILPERMGTASWLVYSLQLHVLQGTVFMPWLHAFTDLPSETAAWHTLSEGRHGQFSPFDVIPLICTFPSTRMVFTSIGYWLWKILKYFQDCLWEAKQRVTESNQSHSPFSSSLSFLFTYKVAWTRDCYTQVLTRHLNQEQEMSSPQAI